MLGSSILLLVIGVPRFLAELMLVPGTPIYERISLGEHVSDKDLDVLENSRLQAIEFVDLPRAYTDLGTAYLIRAQRAPDEESRRRYAEMAIQTISIGLNMAPLNTFAWSRVSSAHILLGPENYPQAVTAWRVSVQTAPFEPFLLIQRIHIATILYRSMDAADIALLKDQIGMTYNWNRAKLRAYAAKNGLIDWMVFLAPDDSDMAQYMAAK